jgi:uncharacterized membrane protein YdjX (TVP38/TMEM64 family)
MNSWALVRQTCRDALAVRGRAAWRWPLVLAGVSAVFIVIVGLVMSEAGSGLVAGGKDALRPLMASLAALQPQSPLLAVLGFGVVFAGLSAASLPGCSLLALGAGALWGPWWGGLCISVASALGALLPFHLARRLGRERLLRRFPAHGALVDDGVRRAGLRYLLVLRLLPVMPYAVVNPLMGLTAMRARAFLVVSALGMLPGSIVYAMVGAGMGSWMAGGASWPVGVR